MTACTSGKASVTVAAAVAAAGGEEGTAVGGAATGCVGSA